MGLPTRILPVLLALFCSIVVAFPTTKRGTHFTLEQGQLTRAPRSPAAEYLRALRKYSENFVPARVVSAVDGDKGTAPAIPEAFDSEYLTPITVGGQGMNVAIDTGSADLWIFSSELPPDMRGDHDLYTPGPQTQKLSGQRLNIQYGDGSTASGDVYIENVTVAGVSAPRQAVGAARTVSALFVSDENNDGIMGLGFQRLSSIKPDKQKSWFENVEDDLENPLYAVTLKRKAPGTFDFGFIDKTKFKGEIKYAPVNDTKGFWTVDANAFMIGGEKHQAHINGVVDTGTSLLLIPEQVAQAYYAKVPDSKYGAKTGGYEFPCNLTLPDFSLIINGYKATVPGEYVKYQPTEKGGSTCFGGIQPGSNPESSVFGDVLLKSQYVVFDSGNKRVGWANQA